MPFVHPCLSQIQKRSSNRKCRHKQPNRRENPASHRLESPVAIPNCGYRHNRKINRVQPPKFLHKMHNPNSNPNTKNHNP
ncbi:hypothetical protein PanWU01x14_286940 [Parasponia andersonii]|uniref:Uncharacterized protein n=1 Tax=Parasponia andersonii TaxID=3476 RepID=A0A2P5AYT7_PARAD|nr:hypothetical protein PanWU01x14_286940 [Parasponia andersonii]